MKTKIFTSLVLFVLLLSGEIAFGQWEQCNNGLPYCYNFVFGKNNSRIFLGCYDGLYFTTDNGSNWNEVGYGIHAGDVYSIETSGDTVYVGTGSGMNYSTNNGKNWIRPYIYGFYPAALSLASLGNYLYVGMSDYGLHIFKKNDTSWAAATNLIQNSVFCIMPDKDILFAGLADGIYQSIDSGYTWNKLDNKLTNSVVINLIKNNEKLYAVMEYSGVILSTDRGLNWHSINNGLIDTNMTCLTILGDTMFAGTYYKGIFYSTNGGNSWIKENSFLKDSLIQGFLISGDYIFVGAGSGIFRTKISDFGKTMVKDFESSDKGISLYPNPTQSTLNIHLEQEYSTPSQIKIIDILGQEVLFNIIQPGIRDYKIDLPGLLPGLYFISFQNGTVNEIKKFLVN